MLLKTFLKILGLLAWQCVMGFDGLMCGKIRPSSFEGVLLSWFDSRSRLVDKASDCIWRNPLSTEHELILGTISILNLR